MDGYAGKENQGASASYKAGGACPSPIAQFAVGAQTCLVFQKHPRVKMDESMVQTTVGEMEIADQRYVIVVQKENVRTQADARTLASLLTKREIQIVTLVAEGLVNKQIADKLSISEWTVSTHLRRIFAKLGVDSRASMVYRCALLL